MESKKGERRANGLAHDREERTPSMTAKSTAAKRSTPGIRVRHKKDCASAQGSRCNCDPTCEAWVFDRRAPVVGKDGETTYGRKIYKSFTGKGAFTTAKQWRSDASSQLGKGQLSAPTRATFRDAANAWIAKCEAGEILSRYRRPYAPSALRGYKRDLEHYLFPDFGARRLSDLTADDFQDLVDRLVGKGLSGSKVRNLLVPCQALYRRYRRQVPVDPTSELDLPESSGRRERAATPREAAALLAPLGDDLALWATAFYAGCRRGELRALRVSDVRGLDGEGVASINVQHGWDDEEGRREPKSKAGVREIPVSETLRVVLAEHVARTGRRGDDLLFGRTARDPFTPSDIRKRAAKAWASAAVGAFLRGESLRPELVPIKLHECRHSYSSLLDAAGISEARADRYMGHSNTSVASRYRHQLDGQLAEDAATIEAYLSGSASGKVVLLAVAS